ncbi:3'-5' exonuclease [Penaeicola halotolerans]|uniref:3'-5' exonuclease n=1 Tax=Penaeicola halotolerans TaxID=2793196 RepID=UPI001CF8C2CE|nr:3'-5' exonuclease [Penaeicola halotolerans]
MFQLKDTKNILFLDIETISAVREFSELSPEMQQHWQRKSSFMRSSEAKTPETWYNERAAIYAEFGQVVVVGVGFLTAVDEAWQLRVKAYSGSDEKQLLEEVAGLLRTRDWKLCAHNGKEFDFPYLCRRMLINGITLPDVLHISGRKPWEISHIDTMELWKFGDYKHYTSLDLLAQLFQIPSSKSDIDGSQVGHTYYQEGDLPKIIDYCLEDVMVTAKVYLSLQGYTDHASIEIIKVD